MSDLEALNEAVAALTLKTQQLLKRNEELEQKNAEMIKRNELIKKKAEFNNIAVVLMEHCLHLGISDDAVNDCFEEEFMENGYKGIYEALVQMNEECGNGCEECAAILLDFKTE